MNNIKSPSDDGGALLLQVTVPARNANFVTETKRDGPDGTETVATYLADVRIHTVRDHLVIVDRDRVGLPEEAALMTTAIADTKTVYRTTHATIAEAGHGYQVQLSVARDAGMHLGDTVLMDSAPGLVVGVRSRADCSPPGDSSELTASLLTIRNDQVSNSTSSEQL